jgi:hypothetical protein
LPQSSIFMDFTGINEVDTTSYRYKELAVHTWNV